MPTNLITGFQSVTLKLTHLKLGTQRTRELTLNKQRTREFRSGKPDRLDRDRRKRGENGGRPRVRHVAHRSS